jgi:hypothetical protein
VHRIKSIFNTYRLFWLAVLLLLGGGTWWLLFISPQADIFTQVVPEEVKSVALDDSNPPAESVGKDEGPIKVEISKATLTVASTDGELKMRVWADKAVKNAGVYKLQEGALEFALQNRETLLLRVSDAGFRVEANTARVEGTIIGQIKQSNQFFSAEKLSWNLSSHSVRAERVRYVGPNIEVSGAAMTIDLATGVVEFDGPVQAGI